MKNISLAQITQKNKNYIKLILIFSPTSKFLVKLNFPECYFVLTSHTKFLLTFKVFKQLRETILLEKFFHFQQKPSFKTFFAMISTTPQIKCATITKFGEVITFVY